MGTSNQIDPRGDHGRRVDQRRHRRRAGHGVGQPGLQWQLCGFTDSTTEQGQGGQSDPEVAFGEHLRRLYQQFLDIQRAQLHEQNEQTEGHQHVADPGHQEGLECSIAILALGVIEADQQVTAHAHAFPAQIQEQQIIGQNQAQHAGDKQVGIGKEP